MKHIALMTYYALIVGLIFFFINSEKVNKFKQWTDSDFEFQIRV